MLRSTAGAFGSLMVGYVLMTAAPSIAFLLPAVVVRSLGAATLWVYSTLLLQYRVENRIQGGRCALRRRALRGVDVIGDFRGSTSASRCTLQSIYMGQSFFDGPSK